LQLELLNLQSAAPVVRTPTPLSDDSAGFADVLQQARGLSPDALRSALQRSIDVPEPQASPVPAGIDSTPERETLLQLLEAADAVLQGGMVLPHSGGLSSLVGGIDLPALQDRLRTSVAGLPVQEDLPFDMPLDPPVLQPDTRLAGLAPELRQQLVEFSEQLSRWSAALAQMPMSAGGAEPAAPPVVVDNLHQALQVVAERFSQTLPADERAQPLPASVTAGIGAPSAAPGGLPGEHTAHPLPAVAVPPAGLSRDASRQGVGLELQHSLTSLPQAGGLQGSLSLQQPTVADHNPVHLQPGTSSAIGNLQMVDVSPPEAASAQRSVQIDAASVRPLSDGDTAERRPGLSLRERLMADNQISLREIVSGNPRDGSPLTNLDQMVRGASAALEARTVSIDPTVTVPASAARAEPVVPNQTTRVPLLADETAQVWVRSSEELPERILLQVSRMHANALRLQAGGATDFVQRLTLHLTPAELGQVEVQLRAADQVSITFTAREASTRDLLDAGVMRLRQMFEEQGLSLGDVEVGGHSGQQEAQDGRDGLQGRPVDGRLVDGDSPRQVEPSPMRGEDGMLHIIA
jgi:hypothetical protein